MQKQKFKNKYTIKSARLEGYDYRQNGMYFVTICAKNREKYFGEIIDEKMMLSNSGKIIQEELLQTAIIRPNVKLDTYVIMPNHLHIILEIAYQIENMPQRVETPRRGVSTMNNNKSNHGGYNSNWKPNSLGSIVNQFKSVCTKRIQKQLNPITFAWQSRFYDHIIGNEKELSKIREYIINNPENWERDRNNAENLFI